MSVQYNSLLYVGFSMLANIVSNSQIPICKNTQTDGRTQYKEPTTGDVWF